MVRTHRDASTHRHLSTSTVSTPTANPDRARTKSANRKGQETEISQPHKQTVAAMTTCSETTSQHQTRIKNQSKAQKNSNNSSDIDYTERQETEKVQITLDDKDHEMEYEDDKDEDDANDDDSSEEEEDTDGNKHSDSLLPKITDNTNIHWAIFEVPLFVTGKKPPTKVAKPLFDILVSGVKYDNSFSIINRFLSREEITPALAPRENLLNLSLCNNTIPGEGRARQFANRFFPHQPQRLKKSKDEGKPNWLFHVEVNIASSLPISRLIEQLDDYFSNYGGSASLQHLNYRDITTVGALLLSSPAVNRGELGHIIETNVSAPVHLYLDNLVHMTKCFLKEFQDLKQVKNIIAIDCRSPDQERVTEYLTRTFPIEQTHESHPASSSPIYRKMIFLSVASFTRLPEEDIKTAITDHHNYTSNETPRHTNIFKPLSTVITTNTGETMTLARALSLLPKPILPTDKQNSDIHDTATNGTQPQYPIIIYSTSSRDYQGEVVLYYQSKHRRDFTALINDLDRAFEATLGITDLNTVLQKHAIPYKGQEYLLRIWDDGNSKQPAADPTTRNTVLSRSLGEIQFPPKRATQDTATEAEPKTTSIPDADATTDNQLSKGDGSPAKSKKRPRKGSPKKAPKSMTSHKQSEPISTQQLVPFFVSQSEAAIQNTHIIQDKKPKHGTTQQQMPTNPWSTALVPSTTKELVTKDNHAEYPTPREIKTNIEFSLFLQEQRLHNARAERREERMWNTMERLANRLDEQWSSHQAHLERAEARENTLIALLQNNLAVSNGQQQLRGETGHPQTQGWYSAQQPPTKSPSNGNEEMEFDTNDGHHDNFE